MNTKNAIIELPEELTEVEIEWEVGQKFDEAGDGHTFFHFADGKDKDGNKYNGTAEVVDGEVAKINDVSKEETDFVFVDAQQMAMEHPATFEVPTKEELQNLGVGDLVKVCNGKERFWTLIREINGDKIIATVENNLIDNSEYDFGSQIEFELRHIYSIYDGFVEDDDIEDE